MKENVILAGNTVQSAAPEAKYKPETMPIVDLYVEVSSMPRKRFAPVLYNS
jgi:hypothetical protein